MLVDPGVVRRTPETVAPIPDEVRWDPGGCRAGVVGL